MTRNWVISSWHNVTLMCYIYIYIIF